MARSEMVAYWRGLHKNIPDDRISGRILFETDTGDVFLEYQNLNDGQIKRQKLTDSEKLNISGGTLTGDLVSSRDVLESDNDYLIVNKKYVDALAEKFNKHEADTTIHISESERSTWNNKVDQVTGKGLSANDFTNEYKTKLDNIAEDATKVSVSANQTSGNLLAEIKVDSKSESKTTKIYSPNFPTSVSGNAGTATRLAASKNIDGVKFDGSLEVHHHALSNSGSSNKSKLATIANYVLAEGSIVFVTFAVPNTAESPELNVSNTGSYPITCNRSTIAADVLKAGTYGFVYTNNKYELLQSYGNRYSVATTTADGLMSKSDKTKLDNISESDLHYQLPTATSSNLGGVKIGDNVTVQTDGTISVTQNDVINAIGYTPLDGTTLSANSNAFKQAIGTFTGATESKSGTSGLVVAPQAGSQNSYLKGDGTWSPISNTEMVGASPTEAGKSGLVPMPGIGDNSKFLRGDGTWEAISSNSNDSECYCTKLSTTFIDDMIHGTYTSLSDVLVNYSSNPLKLEEYMFHETKNESFNSNKWTLQSIELRAKQSFTRSFTANKQYAIHFNAKLNYDDGTIGECYVVFTAPKNLTLGTAEDQANGTKHGYFKLDPNRMEALSAFSNFDFEYIDSTGTSTTISATYVQQYTLKPTVAPIQ